jgi:4-hydroxybutyrate dehydrogenase / sulfolactaldehyde 3-reductase
MPDDVRVGFLGLGLMGLPMATQVVNAGYPLTGFDPDGAAVERLVALGGTAAGCPREVAEHADLVISMLPHPDVVRAALLDPDDGVIATSAPPRAVVEMSTSGPDVVRECADRLAARGIAVADAPVGKGPWAAKRGDLTILFGGDDAVHDFAKPVLATIGSTIRRCGPLGSGQVIKLANNLVSCANIAVLAEAYQLVGAYGADTEVLIDVMAGTSADSWQLRNTLIGKILAGDVSPMFKLKLAYKDMRLVLDLADRLGTAADAGQGAFRWYDAGMAAGHAEHDWGAIVLVSPDPEPKPEEPRPEEIKTVEAEDTKPDQVEDAKIEAEDAKPER